MKTSDQVMTTTSQGRIIQDISHVASYCGMLIATVAAKQGSTKLEGDLFQLTPKT